VPDGVDSSPELEAQAKQKADAISSPAKKFTPQELSVFAGQLTAQYKELGGNPERFSSIADSWFALPEAAQKGARGRFFMGRNERSLETEKLNEAFDSRVNQQLESKQASEVKATREQAFKSPTNITMGRG
jgi:hypothetical protein